MRTNAIAEKSKAFALVAIRDARYLQEEKKEYVLSRQFIRSATSVGANVREATQGFSRKDFRAKMSIALKEACETEYWLELLYESGYLPQERFQPAYNACKELIRILTAIVKTTEPTQETTTN